MSEHRHDQYRYRVDAAVAKKTFGMPAPDNKPEQQPKRGRSKEKKPLSPEEEALRKEVQNYIDARGRSIQTFAGDVSLTFKLGSAFYIDLEKGVVSMDIRWFKDKNCTKEQIFWAILHELSHFKDLKADPKGTEEGFEYLKERARETARFMLQKIEAKFGASHPEYVAGIKKQRPINPKKPAKGSFNAVEKQAFRFHHRMDNILKDIYVNHDVRRNAPTYADGAEGAEHVTNLYKDKLFPGTDYRKGPLHNQMMDALLRQEMVPGETVTVSPEVEEVLARKMTVFGKKYTARELIDRFIKPARDRSTSTSTRDFLIRETIEPLYLELLMKDLEKWDPEKPPQPQKSENSADDSGEEGESQEGDNSDPFNVNPFQDTYDQNDENSPDQFDESDVDDWQEHEKKRDADNKAKQEQEEAEAKKTPAEKAKEAQKSKDAAWCAEHAIKPETLESFREIEAKVKPHVEELAQLWQYITGLGGRETRRVSRGYFKTGSPDIPHIIQNFPGIVTDNEQLAATTLEQSRVMRREVREELPAKFPELIRVRVVGDLSGSMYSNKDRLEALQQAIVLIMTSLREFNYYLDQSRGSSGTKLRTDTEVWGFGSRAQVLKKFRQDDPTRDDLAAIVSLVETTNQDLGGTADFSALEGIEASLSEQDKKAIREGKILEIVLEITDGGSDDPKKTRESIDRLTAQGCVVRSLQIGAPNEGEIKKFESAWNKDAPEALGQLIGGDLSKLAPAVAELLKLYLGGVKI